MNTNSSSTSLKSSRKSQNRGHSNKVCLGRGYIFGPDITRGHSIAPECVRWRSQLRCFGGDIEDHSSGLESPQIDRHPVPLTAVLAVTDPKLLNCRSSLQQWLIPPATAKDPQFSRLRPVAASTAATKVKCRPICGQSRDCCDLRYLRYSSRSEYANTNMPVLLYKCPPVISCLKID